MTDLQKILELIEAKEKADGCRGCTFEDKNEWEMPCSKCKRGCKDYWRPKHMTNGSDQMTREERKNAIHCLKVMIDEEVCKECPLYGTTGKRGIRIWKII